MVAGHISRVSAAPAKLNLGLHVLRKRPDGFHDIETVFVSIGWRDRLGFSPAGSFSFTCSDPALPTDEANLCVRAAVDLARLAGVEPWGTLHLDKAIPHGAGLGGGSSDAVATLRLLSEAWQLDLPAGALHSLAADLGSDVPFFLHDQPMLATGRGELLQPLASGGYELPYPLAVVMPPVQVSTAEAYRLVTPSDERHIDLVETVRSNDLPRWRRELVNDFEAPIAARYPEIAIERDRLTTAGAGYAAMSGSGAAVFGVFDTESAASAAAESARQRGLASWWGYAGDSDGSSFPR